MVQSNIQHATSFIGHCCMKMVTGKNKKGEISLYWEKEFETGGRSDKGRRNIREEGSVCVLNFEIQIPLTVQQRTGTMSHSLFSSRIKV